MNRILKAFSLLSLIVLAAACKSDDDNIVPPRDYGVQYTAEKVLIEEFLKSHYVTVNTETFEATFDSIKDTGHASIWDQTEYPLQHKIVTKNDVIYTLYYLSFREGVNERPTSGDSALLTYRGTLLNGTQFEYQPVTSVYSPFPGFQVLGFPELLPFFKSGNYVNVEGQPAGFTDYGAGAMFVPSGLAYFNSSPSSLVPAYSPMIFTFQLLDVRYTDLDGDGILNRYEIKEGINPTTGLAYTMEDTDTDGDEIPDYLDTDDDGDGRLTRDEIRIPGTTNQYYAFDLIPVCSETGLKVHLDKNLNCVVPVVD